ncbi:MAG: HEAT repeat domain-containing protein [Planctomycetota bacterium]|jgi:hypothetical protein
MRRLATVSTLLSLLSLTACGTTVFGPSFAEPNALMGKEIGNRVAQMPYQHRQELLDNMLWLATKAGEQAIPTLLDGLHHKEPKVRSSCAWVLCKIGDKRVIPYLQEKTGDDHEAVRLEVARSLVYLGDMKQIPTLIKGLDSEMALKDATKRDFGYDHLTESDRQRKRSVLAWWQWWGKQAKDPWFAQNYAKENGLRIAGQTEGQTGGQPPDGSPVPPMPGVELPGPPLTPDPDTGGNAEEDPFKELPEFEEIDVNGLGTEKPKPTPEKTKKN